MQWFLRLKVLVAQNPLLLFKGLAHHIRHDGLPLGFFTRLNFEVSKNRRHSQCLLFSQRFLLYRVSVPECPT